MPELQVRRLGYALGAAITGIDLTKPIDDATLARIQALSLEDQLLVFRDQQLHQDQFVAFVSRFGAIPDGSTKKNRDSVNSLIAMQTNRDYPGKPAPDYKNGLDWHTDGAFLVNPTKWTFLLAKEIPPVGGDTLFANQYMAYEALSDGMKSMLGKLEGLHKQRAYESRLANKERPAVVHPVIPTHPGTKRKVLYLGKHLRQIVGMTPEESRPLLDYLEGHATRYEFTYRHRWQPHDLLMWDNRCLMHLAVVDYNLRNQPRHLWKSVITGDRTGRFFEPEAEAAAQPPALVPVAT